MRQTPNQRKSSSLISVIVPVYNGEKYLGESLESIESQTYPNVEVVVVDDGSTDKTKSVAKNFPLARCLSQSHCGLSAALNNGIKNSRGEFFAFLDADDLWIKDKLTFQMEILKKNPGVEAVFGHLIQFASSRVPFENSSENSQNKIPGFCKGSMLIRRKAFFRVGFFDPRWEVGDFIDWYKRAKEKNLQTLMIPQVVMKRRVHAGNMSSGKKGARRDYVRILKDALDRQKEKEALNRKQEPDSKGKGTGE